MEHLTATSSPPTVADLADAVAQLEGLTIQVGRFDLPADTCAHAPELTRAVCHELGVPLSFGATGRAGPDHAAAALGAEIRRAQRDPALAGLEPEQVAALARSARQRHDAHRARFRRRSVRRPDGTVLTVVETGPPDAPGVLISPACAMGYRLALPWLEALGDRYRCLVLQTRGTSEQITDPGDFDRRGYSVPDQAADVVAVIRALTTSPVHLMGLCGGAVPALLAAADQPALVHSLSLWHADLELGDEAAKTDHQVNLRALLDLAGQDRAAATAVRDMLTSSPMSGIPDRIGPLVVTPYATGELLYRYAKLVGATMHWDSRATATQVGQPCLMITSGDDHTAHPEGSRRLAEILPDARLDVTGHGTHLDAFCARDDQVATLTSFLRSLASPR